MTNQHQQPLEITDANFEAEVLRNDRPVLVEFWAPWCGPCRTLGPIIDNIARQSDGKFKVGKLNIDDNLETARAYDIQSIPSVLIFKDGKVEELFIGVQAQHRYEQSLAGVA